MDSALSIGLCDACRAQLFPQHVVGTLDIPQAPQHVALLWECPYCSASGRLAAERSAWSELLEQAVAVGTQYSAVVKAGMIELDAISTVNELIALWDSYPQPPPVEVAPGRGCGCAACQRRRFL